MLETAIQNRVYYLLEKWYNDNDESMTFFIKEFLTWEILLKSIIFLYSRRQLIELIVRIIIEEMLKSGFVDTSQRYNFYEFDEDATTLHFVKKANTFQAASVFNQN